MLREEGNFSVGGAAETTNGVKTQHRLASVHMRSATTSHDTLPVIDRVFVFLEQGLWSTKQRHDTNGLASRPASLPFVCHLKVVESSRGRGLTQKPPQYGTALRNLSLTKTPHCYSLMMRRDLQRTHSQISSRPVWEMKRKGGLLCLHVCSFGRLS